MKRMRPRRGGRRFVRTVRQSRRALGAHRLRAGLALTSVAIGVAAVVVTSAIGTGMQRDVLRRMESVGTNLLVVRPAQVRQLKRLGARAEFRGFVTTLEVADYEAIAALDDVAAAAPGAETTATVKAGTLATTSRVLGTTTAFLRVQRLRVEAGRFIEADDDRHARRVVVLGGRAARTLFPERTTADVVGRTVSGAAAASNATDAASGVDTASNAALGMDAGTDADTGDGVGAAIGREVRIRGVPFEVVGVLALQGSLADGAEQDNQVIVPIRTALRRVLNVDWLSTVFVSVRDLDRMGRAETGIAALLRERHRLDGRADDFGVQNTVRFLAMQKEMADSLTLLTTGLAALALLVGGIGILALMLLSVKERTAEIGLRMALGARPRDILGQFLIEATLLALGGWAAGTLLGVLGAAGVALGTTWAIAVPRDALIASFAMAVATGLGFGAVPARRASLLPPIEALRVA